MAQVHAFAAILGQTAGNPSTVTQGDGTVYPFGVFDRSTGLGFRSLDVFAAMYARVTLWNFHVTATGSGSDSTGTFELTFSETLDLPTTPTITTTEKRFAVPGFVLAFLPAVTATGGSWTYTYNEPEEGEDPHDPLEDTGTVTGDATVTSDPAQSLASGVLCLMPFSCAVTCSTGGTHPANVVAGTTVRVDPPTFDYEEIGTLTITIPDWLTGSGTVSLVCPIYNAGPLVDGDIDREMHLSVVMTPRESLPYGFDPANPADLTTLNPIWNDDGTANTNPLG